MDPEIDVEYTLGAAFNRVPIDKMRLATEQMSILAKGERDAVAVTRLLLLEIDVPFKAPLFNDVKGNNEYWPQVRTWAARQLGLESKEKKCEACDAHSGFTYDKISKVVTCNSCGGIRSRT